MACPSCYFLTRSDIPSSYTFIETCAGKFETARWQHHCSYGEIVAVDESVSEAIGLSVVEVYPAIDAAHSENRQGCGPGEILDGFAGASTQCSENNSVCKIEEFDESFCPGDCDDCASGVDGKGSQCAGFEAGIYC
jgi:hypothetical protein